MRYILKRPKPPALNDPNDKKKKENNEGKQHSARKETSPSREPLQITTCFTLELVNTTSAVKRETVEIIPNKSERNLKEKKEYMEDENKFENPKNQVEEGNKKSKIVIFTKKNPDLTQEKINSTKQRKKFVRKYRLMF